MNILEQLININALSRLLTGKEQNIRSDKTVPKKYKKDYDDLVLILEEWNIKRIKNRKL